MGAPPAIRTRSGAVEVGIPAPTAPRQECIPGKGGFR